MTASEPAPELRAAAAALFKWRRRWITWLSTPDGRTLWADLGEALYGPDDPRVQQLRAEDPGPWFVLCSTGCGHYQITSSAEFIVWEHPNQYRTGWCGGSQQRGQVLQSLAPLPPMELDFPEFLQVAKGISPDHDQ